jgi:hypothetical protein
MTSNRSTSKLTSKIFPALKAMIFVAGAVTLQACFFGGHPAYGLTLTLMGRVPDMRMADPPPTYTGGRRWWVTTTTITRGISATGGFETTIPGCSSIIRNGSRMSMGMRAITPIAKLPLADSRVGG